MRIDREQRGQSRHYVVRTADPKFTLELQPDGAAPDRIGRGVIKRLSVPNSWSGDYGRYARMVQEAQEFFGQSGLAGEDRPAPRR